MILLNETLSDLKTYARKEYSLTKNVPVLVMLLTEQEHSILKENYHRTRQAEKDAATTEVSKEDAFNSSEEFFPNITSIVKLVHKYSEEAKPTVTPMLRASFDIPNFGKYKYAIMIREEKLLEWGSQMDIQVNGTQATGTNRKLAIYYRILTQEFLHIIEKEKGIQILTNNEEKDSEKIYQAIKAIKIFRNTDIFSD
jgi:hypothetical protein